MMSGQSERRTHAIVWDGIDRGRAVIVKTAG